MKLIILAKNTRIAKSFYKNLIVFLQESVKSSIVLRRFQHQLQTVQYEVMLASLDFSFCKILFFFHFNLAETKIILPLYNLCYTLMPQFVTNMANSRWCYNYFLQNSVFFHFHLVETKIILPLYNLCYTLMSQFVTNMANSRWCYK